jgi:hypothetical protein
MRNCVFDWAMFSFVCSISNGTISNPVQVSPYSFSFAIKDCRGVLERVVVGRTAIVCSEGGVRISNDYAEISVEPIQSPDDDDDDSDSLATSLICAFALILVCALFCWALAHTKHRVFTGDDDDLELMSLNDED